MTSTVKYLWRSSTVTRSYTTGVSLHGHTLHSHETLYFLPAYANRNPVTRRILAYIERRCGAVKMNFGMGYWTPPMPPRAAYELEKQQIEDLDLASLVSLTDHDNIEAPVLLRLLPETRHTPISLEWTVPFKATELHIGIHNLPSSSGTRWLASMQEYTTNPKESLLTDLLAGLSEIPDILLVLNHPMWDLCCIGQALHRELLDQFLSTRCRFIHAFELNGLRGWEENQRVVDLAEEWKRPLISGGDRHGREPAGVINLTRATTFAEFVAEVRRDGVSNLLFMPQYRQSLVLRMFHTASDVVRRMPDHPLGPCWDDRTFHPDAQGVIRPLSQIWAQSPPLLNAILWSFKWLEAEPVKAAARLVSRPRAELRLPPLGERETA